MPTQRETRAVSALAAAFLLTLLIGGLITFGTSFTVLEVALDTFDITLPGFIQGTDRLAVYLAGAVTVALGLNYAGLDVRDRVPFLIGLAGIAALAAELLVPSIIAQWFAPVVELVTGYGPGEVSALRFFVYVVAFIIVYYIVEVRLSAAFGQPGTGAKGPSVITVVQSRVMNLLRDYRRIFVAVGAALGIWTAFSAASVLDGVGQLVGSFIDATFGSAPAWSGWIATTVAGYLNFIRGVTGFSPTTFGIIVLALFALAAYSRVADDTGGR